ncbi:unnamed protein product [Ciceribacter sp. T2.26MG-112.2]|nr:unnamed protein product [Ciceribacter naphthalenivorans]
MQIAIYRLQAVKRRFAAHCRTGGFYGICAVHANKRIQILQRLAIFFLCQ